MTSTAGAQATSNGFIGRGVQVDTVVRSYDSFLYKQLVGAQGSGAQLQTQFDQISQVNNLFADRTVGIAPALSGFFTGVNTAANAPPTRPRARTCWASPTAWRPRSVRPTRKCRTSAWA